MSIDRGNFSFTDPVIASGETINSGNFTQLFPNTEILVGVDLVINGGNWTNVKPQPNWVINGGNWSQISRCSHVSPKLVDRGLPVCADNCAHVVDTDEIWIDGVLIDTVYHYEETRV